MASGTVAYWDSVTERKYRAMQRRHPLIWNFVHNAIQAWQVKSVLEVGCGLVPKAKEWVPIYQGIDLNRATDAIHEDFSRMPESALKPWRNVDLFLACGVLEHIEAGYEAFLWQVKALQPRRAILTFFHGLHWDADSCEKDPRGFYVHVYNQTKLETFLSNHGFNFEIQELGPHDTVLLLEDASYVH